MAQRGFTILEILAAIGLLGLLLSIGAMNIRFVQGQMKAVQDIRQLATAIGYARDEAVRLRTNVRISFQSNSYTVDLYDDGTIEQIYYLTKNSSWKNGTPLSIRFNGLGLARGISSSSTTLAINNGGSSTMLSVNTNGYIAL